jgi:hypothetical protein
MSNSLVPAGVCFMTWANTVNKPEVIVQNSLHLFRISITASLQLRFLTLVKLLSAFIIRIGRRKIHISAQRQVALTNVFVSLQSTFTLSIRPRSLPSTSCRLLMSRKKDEWWSYTFTPTCAFMAYCLIN